MKHFYISALCGCSTDIGNVTQAIVSGIPAETVGPAEATETLRDVEVLPPQTIPGQAFGKEVRSLSSL